MAKGELNFTNICVMLVVLVLFYCFVITVFSVIVDKQASSNNGTIIMEEENIVTEDSIKNMTLYEKQLTFAYNSINSKSAFVYVFIDDVGDSYTCINYDPNTYTRVTEGLKYRVRLDEGNIILILNEVR